MERRSICHWPQRHRIRVTRSIITTNQVLISATKRRIGSKWWNNPRRVQRRTMVPKDVDRPTPFYSDKTKLEMRGGERQCKGCWLKQKKEKCSEATCPLPMSHAALSPLVVKPWGRVPSPGQSATSIGPKYKSFQVSSPGGGDWTELKGGEGKPERTNSRATP